MRRFFVSNLTGDVLVLEPATSHHLLHVVKITRGEHVLLFDGQGQERLAALHEVRDNVAHLKPLAPARQARVTTPLHLWLGLPRNPATDLAVRMATEAGATDIHPFLAHRSTVRNDRQERLQRIAKSAAAQSGRADIPKVHPVVTLAELLADKQPDVQLFVASPDGQPAQVPPPTTARAVVVGPEGGLTPQEVEACQRAGAVAIRLGDWVFRTETAVAVAVALLANPT